MAAASAAVDTRTSLGTLPRPIAAVCAAPRAPSRSRTRAPGTGGAAAGGRRTVSFSASLREGARRLPLPPPLNLSSRGFLLPRASPLAAERHASQLVFVHRVVRRAATWRRERATERVLRTRSDTHARTHARSDETALVKRTYVRTYALSGVSCRATTPASCRARVPELGRKEGRKEQARFSLYLCLSREGGGRAEEEARLVGPCGGSWPRDRRRAVGHCAFFVSPIQPRALSVSPSASVSTCNRVNRREKRVRAPQLAAG